MHSNLNSIARTAQEILQRAATKNSDVDRHASQKATVRIRPDDQQQRAEPETSQPPPIQCCMSNVTAPWPGQIPSTAPAFKTVFCPRNKNGEVGECEYVECKKEEWTAWSPRCGENIVRTRAITTVHKIAQRESCAGLAISCPKEEKVTTKKLCEYSKL